LGWACGPYVEEEKSIEGFLGGGGGRTSEGEDHFELLRLDYSKPINRYCEPTRSHYSLSVSLLECHYTLR